MSRYRPLGSSSSTGAFVFVIMLVHAFGPLHCLLMLHHLCAQMLAINAEIQEENGEELRQMVACFLTIRWEQEDVSELFTDV